MKKRMRFIAVAVCLCVLAAVGLGIAMRNVPEVSAASYVATQTLQVLGVTDAVFVEKADDPRPSTGDYLLYTSDEKQYGYFFDVESGRLNRVEHYSLLGLSSTATAELEVQSLEGEDRYEMLLDFAAACLSPDLIGELKLENTNGEDGKIDSYSITEYYNGFPTGSCVRVNYMDGMIYSSQITTGSIFTKDAQGNIVLTNGDDWMEADQTVEIALAYIQENGAKKVQTVKTEEAVCSEIQAFGNELSYWVEVPFVDQQGYERTYGFRINAYTGEIIRATLSR